MLSTESRDPLVLALALLCKDRGGYVAVADKAEVNDQTLWQILNGVKLPRSGNPRGVGPTLRKKLEAAFPGWSRLTAAPPAVSAVRAPPAPHYFATDAQRVTDALCLALTCVPATRRPELKQVFALLLDYPDEPDYASRFCKLLAGAMPAQRKRPRRQA